MNKFLLLLLCCIGMRADADTARKNGFSRTTRTEFRGVWVATVENLDFPPHKNAESFKKNYSLLLEKLKAQGFNNLIFQIRSNCDAFYPSKFNPWSRWLSGQEGHGLNFDPLEFMVAAAHKRGMKFHAWLNPYRVKESTTMSKNAYLRTLPKSNFAAMHPELVLEQKNGKSKRLLLNPGEPAVIDYLVKTVSEIALNYQIDAIHIDDYFYPYEEIGDADIHTYLKYRRPKQSKADWRRENTSKLVSELHRCIAEINRKNKRRIEFGISPFGIWANRKNHPNGSNTQGQESYFTLYADTRMWVKKEWIDYIVPQIYWDFNHRSAPYKILVDWWCEQVSGTKVKLYIGQGAYQAAKWPETELIRQLQYNRTQKNISGESFFRASFFVGANPAPGIRKLLPELIKKP